MDGFLSNYSDKSIYQRIFADSIPWCDSQEMSSKRSMFTQFGISNSQIAQI